jgi:glutamyl/glutaminyl-tRNA synthetase
VFDFDKLEWMNGKYLSLMADESLAFEAFEWWKNYGRKYSFEVENNDYFKYVIGLAKARMKRISDIFERDKYYFQDPLNFDEEGVKKHLKLEGLQEKLQALNQDFSTLSEWKAEALEKVVRMRAKEWGISGAKLIHPLRLLLTGGMVSPGLFELMEVLGPETVIRRIKNYILLLLMLIKN